MKKNRTYNKKVLKSKKEIRTFNQKQPVIKDEKIEVKDKKKKLIEKKKNDEKGE